MPKNINKTIDNQIDRPTKKQANEQLVITLSEKSTAAYLALAGEKTSAEMDKDMEASGMNLLIDIDFIPGITMTSLSVNGKTITPDEAVSVELVVL